VDRFWVGLMPGSRHTPFYSGCLITYVGSHFTPHCCLPFTCGLDFTTAYHPADEPLHTGRDLRDSPRRSHADLPVWFWTCSSLVHQTNHGVTFTFFPGWCGPYYLPGPPTATFGGCPHTRCYTTVDALTHFTPTTSWTGSVAPGLKQIQTVPVDRPDWTI